MKYWCLNNDIKVIIVSNTSESTRENLNNTHRHQKGGLSGKPLEEKSNNVVSMPSFSAL